MIAGVTILRVDKIGFSKNLILETKRISDQKITMYQFNRENITDICTSNIRVVSIRSKH